MGSEKIHMTSKISYLETLIGEMKQGQEAETSRLKSKNLDSILSNVVVNIQGMCEAEVAPLQSANPELAAYVAAFSNRILSIVQAVATSEKKEITRLLARIELVDEILKKAEADLQAELAQGQEEEQEEESDVKPEKHDEGRQSGERPEQDRQPGEKSVSLKTKRNSSKKN